MNSLYIFKFCFSVYFNSSWTEMSFIDMMTNSLLEIWNLVWTKRQKRGKPPRRIRHLRCTWLGTTMFAFFLFLRPGFLPRFRPRHLSFRWIHNVSFHGLYIKKSAKFNGDYNAFSSLLTLLQNSFSPISRDHWMILNCFFHQTLNHYFSYIGSKEKNFRKIWPLKVYSNLNQETIPHSFLP